jgi:hypothetical protein
MQYSTILLANGLHGLITVNRQFYILLCLHLYMVHKKIEGCRNSLDKKRRAVCDWLIIEVAGMCEETPVMHHNHTEAMIMNILIEMEMRLKNLEYLSGKQDNTFRAPGRRTGRPPWLPE